MKVDSIPVNPGTTTINLYYGKSGEASLSNGPSTFIFFDGFANLNQWTQLTSGDAAVTCDGNEVELKARSNGGPFAQIRTNGNYPYSNVMVWCRYRAG